MNGKKFVVFVAMALAAMNIYSQAVTLDEAIKTTATEMGQRLNTRMPSGSFSPDQSLEQTAAEIRQQLTTQNRIAVLNFSSSWQKLSAYVIDELNNAIVRNGSLTVVDRQQLDLLRKERNFQISGEVDDKSQQSIGKLLGAQSVLSGSFTIIGNKNRFRIQVISVETGIVQYSNSIDIKKDSVLTALMPNSKNDDKRIATEREAQRKAEERREKETERQRKANERKEKLDEKTEYAFRNYLGAVSGGFFQWGDEGSFGSGGHMLEIHWSPLPYTNVGLEFNLLSYGDMFGGAFSLGLVYPLISKNEYIFSIFGDGLLELAPYEKKKGLLSEILTPAINTGMLFYWDSTDFGFEVSYRGTFLENYYVHGISIKLIWYTAFMSALTNSSGSFTGSVWKTW